MVGKRFKAEYASDGNLLNYEVEFRWDRPGKVIRADTIGRTGYILYELTDDGRGILKRDDKNTITRLLETRPDGSLVETVRFNDLGSTTLYSWRISSSGQPVVYMSFKKDGSPASPPQLSHRYVEEGAAAVAAASNISNALVRASDWGPLADFANRAAFHGDRSLLVRVSDDGRYLEFIEIWQDRTRLFGLLRAEGDGRFRFLQASVAPGIDAIYEGRLQGTDLVLPSLVEPEYEVRIGKEYDQKARADALHAREIGPEKSWLYYSFPKETEFSDKQLAPALTASADQRARFDEYFTPSGVQAIRDARSRAAAMEETLARIEAEAAAEDAELEALNNMPASGTGVGNVLGAFMKGFGEATAANQALEQSMDNAINRGLAEGAAEYARHQGSNSYGYAPSRYSGSAAPSGNLAGNSGVTGRPGSGASAGNGDALATKNVRVWFSVGMLATDANTVNPSCIGSTFSVNVPWDPKGWGNPGRLKDAVKPFESGFLAKCSQHGKPSSSVVRYHAEGISDDFGDKPRHPQFYYVNM